MPPKHSSHSTASRRAPCETDGEGKPGASGVPRVPSASRVPSAPGAFNELIARSGIRSTQQRRMVYEALMERRDDHPTAQDVFMQVKAKAPSISLATVYNCLETLSESGLIRHVNVDRAPVRYCQNPAPHAHFFCNECGAVVDVPLKTPLASLPSLELSMKEIWEVPPETQVAHAEVTLRGLCAACAPRVPKPHVSKKS